MLKEKKKFRLQSMLRLAREFRDQLLLDKAANTLEQALEEFPDCGEAHVALADVYYKMGAPARARQMLQKLVNDNPNHEYVHYLYAVNAARLGKVDMALHHFDRALQKGVSARLILSRFIPFLLEKERALQALLRIQSLRRKYHQEEWFVQLWTDILLQTDKKQNALRVINRFLKKQFNRNLLLKYIRIKYLADGQDPLVTYQFLKKQMPKMPSLTDQEIRSMQLEYFASRRDWERAEKLIQDSLHLSRGKLHWIKQLIDLKESRNDFYEFEQIASRYFLGNPSDTEMARRLERYYITQFRQHHWNHLLARTFRRHPENADFFRYLRHFFRKRDWLQNCGVTYARFLTLVEMMQIETGDTPPAPVNFIPDYVWEYFCIHFNFHGYFLHPKQLFQNVVQLMDLNPQLLPFDSADIERVFPTWLFLMHFYFVFSEVLRISLIFNPVYGSKYGVPVVLNFPRKPVAISIASLLGPDSQPPNRWPDTNSMRVWEWPAHLMPTNRVGEILLFSENDMPPVLEEIKTVCRVNFDKEKNA